ncbi:hypothetical protein [Sinorhizobium saheli]|uniref:Uncharacterized protein n=1 Tax=Sinorhizobium saheli TaxID=36856 RepID=A0A178XFZ2_SINSA|nr:hypothetical protein [Sinorhizobium saheli]MQW89920.1 hypothetical protein [Sinorhizobium saheli]OAP34170.1 hypothetical protein ATB98_22850 [Sinorhizobium saheli]
MGSSSLESILDSLKEWNDFNTLRRLLTAYFSPHRSAEDIENYRLGKGRKTFKRLRDEVVPVLHFSLATGFDGKVKFCFSNDPPDCYYHATTDTSPRALEITRAMATEHLHIARELNTKGAFSQIVRTEAVLESTSNAISERLNRKAAKAYGDIELLIEAPIGEDRLPPERWDRIIPALRQQAKSTGFRHVHLIGALAPECRYFQLK